MNLRKTLQQGLGLPVLILFLSVLNLQSQNKDLVVLDEEYASKNSILASLPVSTTILQINQGDNLWGELKTALVANPQISEIHFFLTTTASTIELGNTSMGLSDIEQDPVLTEIGNRVGTETDINLFVYSCTLANNAQGTALLREIGSKTHLNVLGSKSCTSIFDPQFLFDFSSKGETINATSIFQ